MNPCVNHIPEDVFIMLAVNTHKDGAKEAKKPGVESENHTLRKP